MKFVVFAAALAAATAHAAPPAIDVAALKQDTMTLASDAFEGRQPGTPGGDKAVAYIIERMQAEGLQPGNNGQWTQAVRLVTITADPKLTLAVTGGTSPLTFRQPDDVVLWTKRQAPQVAVEGSPMVFVGYGINAPERGWNDYAGLDARGKTVVMLINDPDWQTPQAGPDAGPFEGRAMTNYGRWIYKLEEAARQGAAAAIIVHSDEPAAYPWGVVVNSNAGPKIDLDRPDKGMRRAAVEGWMTQAAAQRLFAAAGRDFAALSAAAKVKGFTAVPLPLQASTAFANRIAASESQNVIGVLPGAKRPNEVVLFTAHWDHLGRCPADKRGDTICNGAVDNASGTAGLLALAKVFAKAPRTARTTAFLAVTAEESGLLGSQFYAENPVYPLNDTVGGINMDGLNVVGPTRNVVLFGGGKSEIETLLTRAAKAQNRVITPEPTPEKGYYYRSDHFSLAKLGVPMAYAEGGDDIIGKPAGYGKAAAEDYTASRYHKASDNYDPGWDWRGAVQDLQMYYAVGRQLADGNDWPNWYPTAEFRKVRDASRAGGK